MKKLITIIVSVFFMQNATAQVNPVFPMISNQASAEYNDNFIKISVAFAAIPKEKTDFDGVYTKINTDETMKIENNTIVFQSIDYPNLNHQLGIASSYDNRWDNAKTTTTTYSFLKSENNVFLVFGIETQTTVSGLKYMGSPPPMYPNGIIKTATYYDEKIRLHLGKIIGDIITLNGTYYIKQGPKN